MSNVVADRWMAKALAAEAREERMKKALQDIRAHAHSTPDSYSGGMDRKWVMRQVDRALADEDTP